MSLWDGVEGGLGRTPRLSCLLGMGPAGFGQVPQVVLAAECLLVSILLFIKGWTFLEFSGIYLHRVFKCDGYLY